MSDATKTCMNCEHRIGSDFSYAKCVRTGFFCTIELNFGGRCAGPRDGVPQLNLWELRKPRPTFWMRVKKFVFRTHTAAQAATKD